jgi:hypothetical protein
LSWLIVGIDPGKSVGVAALLDTELYGAWQLDTDAALDRFQRLVDSARRQGWVIDVAVERYSQSRSGGAMTQQNDALTFAGKVEAISTVPIHLQQPSDARGIAPNERLRRLGLYVRPYDVHASDADDANSAMRHAVLLLARRHATLYEKLLRERGLLDART